ncbi:hypothetical protein SAMN05216226_11166 [Halovenus aranensis]|uniref:N-acetyltransferase domain-containing protein n=1 Tax=Halovenus aranensis TaxID=890420 RepID=A0A1G8XGQ0_9EURY|nr:hypothetical protein [Halovenus aranensis]SDJ89673.1 hypothetical protein SAMN05216226_11166 [Halovenus aranensis]
MELRDAVEADAERLASLTDAPQDVMRNLVHDRTVRVAGDEDITGFVSFDARQQTVYVTQIEGTPDVYPELLEEPLRFARAEGMDIELFALDSEADLREAALEAGFEEVGPGPRFEGEATTRYRLEL